MVKEIKTKKTVLKKTLISKTVAKAPVSSLKVVKKETIESTIKVKISEKGTVSASVYAMSGKAAGKISLPGEIFNAKVNPELMAQAVRVYLFGQRRGTASTKTRGEVRGTTKKIYRQKGTGRARHGAAKAPIFVGGGITFGPRPHDFSLDFPKKMKKKALFSALTEKLQEENLKIVDMGPITGKTREMVQTLKNLSLLSKNGSVRKVMVIVDHEGEIVLRASKNIEGVVVQNVSSLNTYEIINSNKIIFMKESIETLKKVFLKN